MLAIIKSRSSIRVEPNLMRRRSIPIRTLFTSSQSVGVPLDNAATWTQRSQINLKQLMRKKSDVSAWDLNGGHCPMRKQLVQRQNGRMATSGSNELWSSILEHGMTKSREAWAGPSVGTALSKDALDGRMKCMFSPASTCPSPSGGTGRPLISA